MERLVRVAAGVCMADGRILLTRRPPGGEHGGMWEFPGGKIEDGESPQAAVSREVAEELGVDCTASTVLAVERHRYPSGLTVEIAFVECRLHSPDFVTSDAVHEFRWARPAEVDPMSILAADRPFLANLAAAGKDR